MLSEDKSDKNEVLVVEIPRAPRPDDRVKMMVEF